MTSLKISDQLAQPQVLHYISILGRISYRNINCTMEKAPLSLPR